MNYTLYLQNGAELAQPKVENSLGKEEVDALVKAIIVNQDENAAKELVENFIKDPENGWIRDWIAGAKDAAESGNQDAIKFWQIVEPLLKLAEQAQSLKCGGKVRAKIKKAYGGKKMQAGNKITPKKDCPCKAWKKVGGKLTEVDCTETKIQKGQFGLQFMPKQASNAFASAQQFLNNLISKEINKGRNFLNLVTGLSNKAEQLERNLAQQEAEFEQNTANAVSNSYNLAKQVAKAAILPSTHGLAIGKIFSTVMEHPKIARAFVPTLGTFALTEIADRQQKAKQAAEAAANQQPRVTKSSGTLLSDRVMQSRGFTKNEAGNWVKDGVEYDSNGQPIVQEAPVVTWRDTFGTGKSGRFGGLTYDEALARQNEMKNAGFTNFGASDGMWGNKSKAEWERYQLWKTDQELAARKAPIPGLLRIESSAALNPTRITVDNSTATAPFAVTRNGDIVRTSSLTPGQALSQLNAPAWEEYTRRLRQGILSSKNGGKMSYADYLK